MKYSDYETNCPSCNRLWIYDDSDLLGGALRDYKLINPYPKTCLCGLKISQLRNINYNGSKILSLQKAVGDYIIEWNYDLNSCNIHDDKWVWPISWLPLDMTEEQLKLYLTFL